MNPEDRPVKLTISGRLQFEDQITLAQAAHIVAYLDSGNAPTGPTHQSPQLRGLGNLRGGLSNPREALDASRAKTNPEKIVALALYVAQDGSKETFSLEDIKPLFRRARESPPGNISRDFDVAIRAGWVSEAETKGEFFVTQKAAHVLEAGFETVRGATASSGSRSRASRTAAGAKRTKKTTAEIPEAFSKIHEISPTLDGYIDYHKLKTTTDKFLWAVNYAKSVGVPAVTNKDLVWLTDKLGEGIISGNIAANFRANHKSGNVNRSTQDQTIRITLKGENYLKKKSQA